MGVEERTHPHGSAGARARKPEDPPFKECTDCPEDGGCARWQLHDGSPEGQGGPKSTRSTRSRSTDPLPYRNMS